MLLDKCNIAVKVLLKDIPAIYSFLPIDTWVVSQPSEKIDLLIALDSSDMGRLCDFGEYVGQAKTIINIDHHASNTNYGHINHVDVKASSTSEMIYELIDNSQLIDDSIACCLYTGIIFDTGVFKHSNTTPKTHETAGALIQFDFDFSTIINQLFFHTTFTALKSKEKAIHNLKIFQNGQVAVTFLTLEELESIGATKDHTEGIVNMMLQVDEVHCSVFLYESEDGVFKASLRSKGKVDVCKVAMAFDGGGHIKASGCTIKGHQQEVINEVLGEIQKQL